MFKLMWVYYLRLVSLYLLVLEHLKHRIVNDMVDNCTSNCSEANQISLSYYKGRIDSKANLNKDFSLLLPLLPLLLFSLFLLVLLTLLFFFKNSDRYKDGRKIVHAPQYNYHLLRNIKKLTGRVLLSLTSSYNQQLNSQRVPATPTPSNKPQIQVFLQFHERKINGAINEHQMKKFKVGLSPSKKFILFA